MKTAQQHNAAQDMGHCEFHPNVNQVRIIGYRGAAKTALKTLVEACGWQVIGRPKGKYARR